MALNSVAAMELFEEQTKHLEEPVLVARDWTLFGRQSPLLDVGFARHGRVPLRIQLRCDDWNERPPSISLLSSTGERLRALPASPTGVFNSSAHPKTGFPFICMAGSLEYHTHSSHLNDSWENYKNRSGYDLGGIVHQIWLAWLKSTP